MEHFIWFAAWSARFYFYYKPITAVVGVSESIETENIFSI